MSRWTTALAAIAFVAFVALGCSGGGNPVAPAGSNDLTLGAQNHGSHTQTHLWGFYDVYIDLQNKTVEAVPNRDVMFAANVVTFVNKPVSNLSFNIIQTPQDPGGKFVDVDIDVSITHPFPGLTQYNGYDVRGIFIGDGSLALAYNGDLKYAARGATDQEMYDYNLTTSDIHSGLVGMPDGYTRWWNPTEFTTPGVLGYTQGKLATPKYTATATLNPYKYYADGLGVEDDLWTFLTTNTTNRVFSAGSTNTRNYYLRFPLPSPGVKYLYAIVANWEAEDVHPSNAIESVGLSVGITPDIYYVNDSDKGGKLILDAWVYGPQYQPSAIIVESTVLSAPYTFTGAPGGGDSNYSTYHIEIPADNITGTEGQEYWVICEYQAFNYTNEYGVTNLAGTDYLAAFFRYDLYVSPEPYCSTTFVSIAPSSGSKNTTINDALITCTQLEDGPKLAAKLTRTGQPDIPGTDVKWVSSTTMTCDFNLTGAEKGKWNVVVTNGCGGTPGVGVDAFEVLGGLSIEKQGNLPTPLPTSTNKHFCVIGDNATGNAGVYYHYSTGPSSYMVYKYPLDYSSGGTSFRTLSHWWGMSTAFGTPQMMGEFQVASNGVICAGSDDTAGLPGYEYVFRRESIPWWTNTAGAFQIGLTSWTVSFNYGGNFRDWDADFGITGDIWGFWNTPFHEDLYFGNQFKVFAPYGTYNYLEFVSYFPYDYSGGQDGQVDDTNVTRLAVDSNPQGVESPWDRIFYYLEAAPAATPAIEVFRNINNMSLPVHMKTIKSFVGTPVDITVFNAYGTGGVPGATGNWVGVLEKNGAQWQVALFDQNGNLIARSSSYNGTPHELDTDTKNRKIHVWYEESGTLKYAIFVFL